MRGDAAWRACGHAPGHPAMPNACLFGGKITSFSKKPSFIGKSLEICGQGSSQGQGTRPRPKAMACMLPRPGAAPHGTRPRPWHACCQGQGLPPMARSQGPCSQGQGMQPRPRQAPKACCQGQGTQPRPWRQAAKAKACCQGQGTQPKAMARSQGQGHGMQPPKARSQGQGMQPPKARCQGQGMQPRPRQAPKACCQGQGT